MAKIVLLKKAGSLHPLSILDRLTKDFLQEDYILSHGFTNLDVLLGRMKALSENSHNAPLPVFTLYPGGDCSFINTLKDKSSLLQKVANGEHSTLSLLKQVVLETILGFSQHEQADLISYSDDLPAALQAVEDGQYALALIIHE